MQKVVFRADGNAEIGMGHFIRSLALAEMLNKEFECIFVLQEPSDFQVAEIEKVCNKYIRLPTDDSHFDLFLNNLDGNEIVVLDNYYFTTDYQREIKTKGCRLVCIDDMADRHFVADVVINHGLDAYKLNYVKESSTKLLLGFRYALLRRDFLLKNNKQKKEYDILLCLGGSDPFNLSSILTPLIHEHFQGKKIAVVYNGTLLIESFNIDYFERLSSREMSELMRKSIIGILPSSTISIEACACNLPFVTGYFVENQMNIYSSLVNGGLASGVGSFADNASKIISQTSTLLKSVRLQEEYSLKQKSILDKKSPERFIKEFYNLSYT